MGSIGLKALKPTVFLVGNEFRLRIPFGKLVRFPNPSVLWDNFIDSLKAQRKLCLLGYKTPHPSLRDTFSTREKADPSDRVMLYRIQFRGRLIYFTKLDGNIYK